MNQSDAAVKAYNREDDLYFAVNTNLLSRNQSSWKHSCFDTVLNKYNIYTISQTIENDSEKKQFPKHMNKTVWCGVMECVKRIRNGFSS